MGQSRRGDPKQVRKDREVRVLMPEAGRAVSVFAIHRVVFREYFALTHRRPLAAYLGLRLGWTLRDWPAVCGPPGVAEGLCVL